MLLLLIKNSVRILHWIYPTQLHVINESQAICGQLEYGIVAMISPVHLKSVQKLFGCEERGSENLRSNLIWTVRY